MSSLASAASRVSAPLSFKVFARTLLAPTVPQAVNGRITAPANGATIVVPTQANLQTGERVRGVLGNHTTAPVTVVTPGAQLSIPVPALDLWLMNMEGPSTWHYEIQNGDGWERSLPVSIEVNFPIGNLLDNFDSLRQGNFPINQLVDRPGFLIRADTANVTTSENGGVWPPLAGRVVHATRGSSVSFLLKRSCTRIEFRIADGEKTRSQVRIYGSYDDSELIANITTPAYNSGSTATVVYTDSARRIRRIQFTDGGTDTYIDDVQFS